ncbi:hypothetical protein GCM10009776_05210 [Microbacterium deminutum]|uniref:Glycosyltransferase RgtA/B/C/D-like domain-containing protein n=1 Tax=Microbacterium deminutum TaxID=344164 RepID=A0ABP5BIQ3_9MICO
MVVGLGALLWTGRGTWFYLDEWDFMWGPEAARRLVEGHNGHWSVVPILVWNAVQRVFGLAHYWPFLLLVIAAHLTLAHLLWRLILRLGSDPWVATALASVFVLYGSAAENILWGFQVGYIGAIAFVVGALLVVLRPTMRGWAVGCAAALLILGVASSGTSLPFLIPVAVVCLRMHGWAKTIVAVGSTVVVYAIWFFFLAGDNPTAIYRASGPIDYLFGIPAFVGRMFVDGFTTLTPVPLFGIVLTTGIAGWLVYRLGRAWLSVPDLTATAMALAGVVFAVLTAYSRLHADSDGTRARYIYVLVVACLPAIAAGLTSIARGSSRRILAITGLVSVVLAYNVGLLILNGEKVVSRDAHAREIVSASLDLAHEYPDDVDRSAAVYPSLVPRSVDDLLVLEERYKLTPSSFGESARLTALTYVGLNVVDQLSPLSHCTSVPVGGVVVAGPEGIAIGGSPDRDVTLQATGVSASGDSRTLTFPRSGASLVLSTPESVRFKVESATSPVKMCGR